MLTLSHNPSDPGSSPGGPTVYRESLVLGRCLCPERAPKGHVFDEIGVRPPGAQLADRTPLVLSAADADGRRAGAAVGVDLDGVAAVGVLEADDEVSGHARDRASARRVAPSSYRSILGLDLASRTARLAIVLAVLLLAITPAAARARPAAPMLTIAEAKHAIVLYQRRVIARGLIDNWTLGTCRRPARARVECYTVERTRAPELGGWFIDEGWTIAERRAGDTGVRIF